MVGTADGTDHAADTAGTHTVVDRLHSSSSSAAQRDASPNRRAHRCDGACCPNDQNESDVLDAAGEDKDGRLPLTGWSARSRMQSWRYRPTGESVGCQHDNLHPGLYGDTTPPVDVTETIKRDQMAAYGLHGQRLADYELDH
jgi:hypothetical protein